MNSEPGRTSERLVWTAPALRRIDAAQAESGFGDLHPDLQAQS